MATIERDLKTGQGEKNQTRGPRDKNQAQAPAPAVPVRKRLATPTDLPSDAVETIAAAVNHLIADALALYVKTKNYHWHLASSHFRDYHLLFDEQADQLLASIDPLAERVRRIGGTTIRSIGHVAELQSIEDDDGAFVPAEDMIANLLTDNRDMAQKQRAAMELADSRGDHPTSNLLQTLLDETEKRIWFLYETSTGEENEE
jgi:starvation-inducible DNA-binding protein